MGVAWLWTSPRSSGLRGSVWESLVYPTRRTQPGSSTQGGATPFPRSLHSDETRRTPGANLSARTLQATVRPVEGDGAGGSGIRPCRNAGPGLTPPQLALRARVPGAAFAFRFANAALPRALRSSSFLFAASRSSGGRAGAIFPGSRLFVV